jgi:hypothetical protein
VNFDYRVELGTVARATLFKKVNNYIADIYWEYVEQISSALIPKDLLAKYLDKKVKVTAKMTYNHRSVLYGALAAMNEGPNKDRMANGYCHLIRLAVEAGLASDANYFLDNMIAPEKRFTPSITMLSIKGYVPDLKVQRYSSLFLSQETLIIRDSVIAKAESELQVLLKKVINARNLGAFLKDANRIRKAVEDDQLSSEIRRVRRERLLVAGRLKDSHKGKSTFRLSQAVNNKLADTRIRDAFNPFRIPFAQRKIETSPGQCITVIEYNDDTGFYRYIPSEYNDALDKGSVKALALEFVAWLEQ